MNPNTGQAVSKQTAADNQVVMTGKCVLQRIIIGADVASSVLEVYDNATSTATSADLRVSLNGSTLMTSCGGVVEVGTFFEKGITVKQTNQTKVTYVVVPVN